ncbi:uncharacterized protein sS8_0023 [Methylocaldum marinum]|uniref:Uncharacterized protein n=1 Tax=Methylocaldum marinum TaxID=1432792 RepID=A0A286T5K1_9GAMM|nr:uncharacterized protein sS8_0023 [Methylocaldum marinum]
MSSPIGALASLLPGFVAGWLARRNPILVGFLAGLLGNVIYSAIFLTQWQPVLEGGPLTVADVALRLVFLGVSWGLVSAAAAGTAQFLRSNKPIHATCEDARA